MNKNLFEDEIILNMQNELRKTASSETPNFIKAGECLHAALEIFEEAGLQSRANEIINILNKIAQNSKKYKPIEQMPSINKLMQHGITQKDMHEFYKGNGYAKAKFNLVLRNLGLSDSEISKFLGPNNLMTDSESKSLLDPSSVYSDPVIRSFDNPNRDKIIEFKSMPLAEESSPKKIDVIEFNRLAAKNKKQNGNAASIKNLSSEKMIKNLKNHGTVFNMSDDNNASKPETFEEEYTQWLDQIENPKNISGQDLDFALEAPLSKDDLEIINSPDDSLLNEELDVDALSAIDKLIPFEDFEDE